MGGNQKHIECIDSRTLLTLFVPPFVFPVEQGYDELRLSCRYKLSGNVKVSRGVSSEGEATLIVFVHYPCAPAVMPRVCNVYYTVGEEGT